MGSSAPVSKSTTPTVASARHHLLNTDGFSHPRENAATLLTTSFAVAAGICALIPALHLLACLAGGAGLLTGGYAQMISATTAERFVNVCAMVVSGLGLLFGLAHGGLY
ncbi:MAG TPA: hypothetical protein VGX23_36190 [Actinocrinis sp.]|nr:hypothetical protein [Actinocrinis sp.]